MHEATMPKTSTLAGVNGKRRPYSPRAHQAWPETKWQFGMYRSTGSIKESIISREPICPCLLHNIEDDIESARKQHISSIQIEHRRPQSPMGTRSCQRVVHSTVRLG